MPSYNNWETKNSEILKTDTGTTGNNFCSILLVQNTRPDSSDRLRRSYVVKLWLLQVLAVMVSIGHSVATALHCSSQCRESNVLLQLLQLAVAIIGELCYMNQSDKSELMVFNGKVMKSSSSNWFMLL